MSFHGLTRMIDTRARTVFGGMIAAAFLTLVPSLAIGGERLLPPSARLVGPHARQRFVVEHTEGPIGTADLTSQAVFATDNPRVATVDTDGFVRPAGDGLATITATVDGRVGAGVDLGRGPRSRRALELPQPRRGGPDQAGVQRGGVSRRGGGQEWVSPDLARLRAGDRPRSADPSGPGPSRREDRARRRA